MPNNQTGVSEGTDWRAPNAGVRTQNYDRFLVGRLLTDGVIEKYIRVGRYGTKRQQQALAQDAIKQAQKRLTIKQLTKRYAV